MKISVMIPTRLRPYYLVDSIKSLLDSFSQDNQIEILVRFDDDDLDSLEKVKQRIDDNRIKYFIGPRLGLNGMHIYLNELISKSDGDWLMAISDNILMQTKNWDKEIEKYNGKIVFIILSFGIYHIVPRKVIEILDGDLYRETFCDSHINEIANMSGCIVPLHNIKILDIKIPRVPQHVWAPLEFWGPESTAIRKHYAELLRTYIARQEK